MYLPLFSCISRFGGIKDISSNSRDDYILMNINLEMVKAGLAEVYRGKPASGLNMEPFWQAEDEAKKAGSGMWSLGDKYVSPRQWRRKKN